MYGRSTTSGSSILSVFAPHDRERNRVILGRGLHEVLEPDAQIVPERHHALIIDLGVTDGRDHVPLLERVARIGAIRPVHDDAVHEFVESEKAPQRGVFERLQLIVHGRLAVIGVTARDLREKKRDLLVRNDVTDVVADRAEGESDHLVVGDHRAAAVAGVECGIDLDAQPRGADAVVDEFDPRDDALGDGECVAPGGEAIRVHRVGDLWERVGAREGAVLLEKCLIVHLQHRKVDRRGNGDHGSEQLIASSVGLNLDLTRVEDDVSRGEYAIAIDDRPASGHLRRRLLGPGARRVRPQHCGKHFDDAVAHAVGGGCRSGAACRRRRGGCQDAELGEERKRCAEAHDRG